MREYECDFWCTSIVPQWYETNKIEKIHGHIKSWRRIKTQRAVPQCKEAVLSVIVRSRLEIFINDVGDVGDVVDVA